MARYNREDPPVRVLLQALQIPKEEQINFLCAPVYRDALVFYDAQDKIVSVLNICLSCQDIALEPFSHVNADFRVYLALAPFFVEAGHAVEKSTLKGLDELLAMYNKALAKKQKS